jgi:2-methylisocitrate lyase-like PEP mutase family enzyme
VLLPAATLVRCLATSATKKTPALRKTTQLKQLLTTPGQLGFLMEAHNGLSAKIVEEAGFKAIWGSGLSISAAMGVRDSNEASWTQVSRTNERRDWERESRDFNC